MKNFEIIKIKILNRVFNLINLLNIGDYDFRDYVIDYCNSSNVCRLLYKLNRCIILSSDNLTLRASFRSVK